MRRLDPPAWLADTPVVGRPPLDAVLARIAAHYSYLDELSSRDQAAVLALGYVPVDAIALPGSLHLMTLFPLPDRPDTPPVLAFRVSGDGGGLDAAGAVTAAMYPFSRNEAAIVAELRALGGGVVVTGHGVGAAVAQIAAAMHPELVARVVGFQSPAIGGDLIERARTGRADVGSLAVDPVHADYVSAWLRIRAEAESGAVLYADLIADLETHALMSTVIPSHTADGNGLRHNLDRLFPELRAASHLEDRVLDGRIASADGLVYTVAAGGVGITEARRARLHVYYGIVFADRELDDAVGVTDGGR